MYNAEFEKYVKNNIIPLYPDALDVPGKRVVMLKVDSMPGRLNIELLDELCFLGFYLYPGVLNTTAVSQETDQLWSFQYSIPKESSSHNQKAIRTKKECVLAALACWIDCIWWDRPCHRLQADG